MQCVGKLIDDKGNMAVAIVRRPKSTMPTVAMSSPMTSQFNSKSKTGELETTPTVNTPVASARPTKAVSEAAAPTRP